MAKKEEKLSTQMRRLYGLTAGGAIAVKGTDLISHARSPIALTGDIQGFTGLGIASGFGGMAMEMALRPMEKAERLAKKRKRRKRK